MNLYSFVDNRPPDSLDPLGKGVLEWMLTGTWDPSAEELRAAKTGYVESYGKIPAVDWSLGRWGYTGEGGAETEIVDAAINSAAVQDYTDCYTRCMGHYHHQAAAAGSALLSAGATVLPIPKRILPSALMKGFIGGAGGSAYTGIPRIVSVVYTKVMGGRSAILTRFASAAKAAPAVTAAKVAAVVAVYAEATLSTYCACVCDRDPSAF
jgi:hypothetical protein